MKSATQIDWQDANQRYLVSAIALVRALLQSRTGRTTDDAVAVAQRELEEAARAMPAPPALEVLARNFGLTPFERQVLVMCAGVELAADFAQACADAQSGTRCLPTFSMALSILPEAHWSALMPSRPLRRWRLIELQQAETLSRAPLRISERVLHYLAGLPGSDADLESALEAVPAPERLPSSQQELADKIRAIWSRTPDAAGLAVIELCGAATADKRAVAAAACRQLNLQLHAVSSAAVPTAPVELDNFMRLLEREAALSPTALLLESDEQEPADRARTTAAERLIAQLRVPLIVAAREPGKRSSAVVTLFAANPARAEQCQLWGDGLGVEASGDNAPFARLTGHFDLGAQQIWAIARDAAAQAPARSDLLESAWEGCKVHTRPRLEELAQRIEPVAGWDDLVLSPEQTELLRTIEMQVRNRATVYEEWGFGGSGARGLGITALFAGPSGTGKTLAAEVLAMNLRLDLYRIDLSGVVSKYIGETEKNLRRVFEAAEQAGAILLFDEADALFGKRSEVKDSHDRYANIEVSYLLQRMEAYRGLAILTTNAKTALDPAFLRRIRFIVQFPFPDVRQRAEIWRRIFPPKVPLGALDYEKLARLNVTGGTIRNIALNAAFVAAERGESVGMADLLRAARAEYAKLEKPLTDGELGGWA